MENLLQELKEGNERAYSYLFEHYFDRLCRVANHYVKDFFVAENLVGDLFFYLWKNREIIEIRESLGSYLFSSVRNRSFNYLEQAHVMREIKFSQFVEPDFFTSSHPDSEMPLNKMIEKELAQKISMSLNSLSPQTRKVFEMKRNENLSYEEISTQLNITTDTVKYHIKSAMRRLRVDLEEYLPLLILLVGLLRK